MNYILLLYYIVSLFPHHFLFLFLTLLALCPFPSPFEGSSGFIYYMYYMYNIGSTTSLTPPPSPPTHTHRSLACSEPFDAAAAGAGSDPVVEGLAG